MLTNDQLEKISDRANKFIKKYKGKKLMSLPKEEREEAIKEAEIIKVLQEKVLEDLLEQIKEKDFTQYKEIKLMIDSLDNDPVKVIN